MYAYSLYKRKQKLKTRNRFFLAINKLKKIYLTLNKS